MKFPKESQYPKTIQVGKVTYKVRFVDKFRGDPLCVGLHQGHLKLIRIKRQDRREMLDTYVHELLHAFEFVYKFNLRHKNVYKLARAICKFLKANQESFRSKSSQRRTRTAR